MTFLVPYNEDAARASIEQACIGLSITFVRSRRDLASTLEALFEICDTSGEWIFFGNSDRYPFGMNGLSWVSRLIDSFLDGSSASILPDKTRAIRLFRWREVIPEGTTVINLLGRAYDAIPMSIVGFYHPQFFHLPYLKDLLADKETFADIYFLHKYIAARALMTSGIVLSPAQALLKFGETTVGGKPTLNFAVQPGFDHLAAEALASTTIFTSPTISQTNSFWRDNAITAEDALSAPAPDAPLIVVSCGVVGPDLLQAFSSNRGGPSSDVARSSRRLPFRKMGHDQRVLYLFEDPRKAVMAIFAGHGERHDPRSLFISEETDPAHHCRALEACPSPMDETWDLNAFLKHGLDLFRLEEHLDFWMFSDLPYDVLFARREACGIHAGAIRAALGLPVSKDPPVFSATPPVYDLANTPPKEGLDLIYGTFAKRLSALPDVFSIAAGESQISTVAR